ncbi:MAG: DUF3575 domain-containing protein [Muribaculaceae bacterium]|nr:DUF3575 domain-containing protein [Muribaculaceae bacterium]
MKKYIFSLIIFCCALNTYAREVVHDVNVLFLPGQSQLELSVGDNHLEIARLFNFLNDVKTNPTAELVRIDIDGYTSFDETYESNPDLSVSRMAALKSTIKNFIDVSADVFYDASNENSEWTWLKDAVLRENLPETQSIVAIINNPPEYIDYKDGLKRDRRLNQLKILNGGETWIKLQEIVFPRMPHAHALITVRYMDNVYEGQSSDNRLSGNNPTSSTATISSSFGDNSMAVTTHGNANTGAISATNVSSTGSMYIWDPNYYYQANNYFDYRGYVKTNFAEIALALANLSVEFDFVRHWAVSLSVSYSGWNYFVKDLKFRALDIKPTFRYYPFVDKNRINNGFYIGVHAGATWFNIAYEKKYRYQNHDKNTPAYGGGIDIGYKLPLSANSDWFMDFGFGAGAYKVNYDKIENITDGKILSTKKKWYFGPDEVSISFGYSFSLNH